MPKQNKQNKKMNPQIGGRRKPRPRPRNDRVMVVKTGPRKPPVIVVKPPRPRPPPKPRTTVVCNIL